MKKIKDFFKLVEKTDFQEVEIIDGDFRLRVQRNQLQAPVATSVSIPSQVVAAQPAPETQNQTSETSQSKDVASSAGQFITSPFVGTFYRSPSPDSKPYVEAGDAVSEGQVLCIVEAMKLMNEIESEYSGVIKEVYVENGQPVEFGEKLFRIE